MKKKKISFNVVEQYFIFMVNMSYLQIYMYSINDEHNHYEH